MNQSTTQLPTSSENAIRMDKSLCSIDSFFDNDERDPKESKTLWSKPNAELIQTLLPQKGQGAPLEKKGKKTGFWISRYYVIIGNYLAYKYRSSSPKIVKVMELDRVRVEYFEKGSSNGKRYGFRFLKNREICELTTKSQDIYTKFKELLQKLCIQVDFNHKYQIEKLIGKGSFGRVYLVKRNSDGLKFASKMFFKENLQKEKRAKPTLLNEINILRSLDHPGIMKLYEIHETHISVHLIVELLSGGELFEKIKEKKNYKEKDCAALLTKMITPLVYLHSKGIMHRDLKPENLILRPKESDYDVVLADFGLATEIQPKQLLHIRCGTPGYCAPEILNSKGGKLDYDSKCDVFSMGCIFYHIITGKHPFYSKNNKLVYYQNRLADVNFNHPKIAVLSDNARDLLKQLLKKDPAKRPTFEEALQHPFFTGIGKVESVNPVLPQKRASGYNLEEKGSEKNLSYDYLKKTDTNNSHLTLGSFLVGRSNIFKGHLDTVPDTGYLSPAVIYPDLSSPGMPVRRSDFSRFSNREIASTKDHPLQIRDSQSISINISIVRSDNTSLNHPSLRDDPNVSKSSRSRSGSKIQSISKSLVGNSVEVPEEKEGSSDDSKGEKSPIFLNVQNLMTGSLRNPFSAEENYDESCVYIKIEKINNISMPSKTIRYPKIFNTITISKFRTSRDFDTESVGSSLNVRKNWYVTS